jgi:hypothetical protein
MIFWHYFRIIQLYLLNVTCIVLYMFGPVATHGHAPSHSKRTGEACSQGSDEGNIFSRREETSTILGNLVNLARPGTGTFNSNWILDSGTSKHVTGASSEFASFTRFPPTYKEAIQTADGTAQCDNPPRKIPYYCLNQSTLVTRQY